MCSFFIVQVYLTKGGLAMIYNMSKIIDSSHYDEFLKWFMVEIVSKHGVGELTVDSDGDYLADIAVTVNGKEVNIEDMIPMLGESLEKEAEEIAIRMVQEKADSLVDFFKESIGK
jgi:hypothetical protein